MSLHTVDFGPRWAWLKGQGWSIRPGTVHGTAECDAAVKVIRVRVEQFYRPSRRTRRFVIPHEIVHALHSTVGYEVDDIRLDLDLTWRAAIEVVANGALWRDGSREVRAWVAGSVGWHNAQRHGLTRYRLRDLSHPTVLATIDRVLEIPTAPNG